MRSEVQLFLGPPKDTGGVLDDESNGGVAQLGERLPCTQEVIGSIPFTSTLIQVLAVEFIRAQESRAEEVLDRSLTTE